jgi:hypothetical protein
MGYALPPLTNKNKTIQIMKKEYTCQFPCDKSPHNLTRERLAYLLRASRSRRGRGNAWHTANGYYIRDAQLTITQKSTSH